MQTFLATKKKKKKKSHYTIFVVSEVSAKTIKQYSVSSKFGKFLAVLFGIVILICVCGTALGGTILSSKQAEANILAGQVEELDSLNSELKLQNEQLTSKVSILSDTINQKVEQEAAVAAEAEEKTLPKGFPLSGTATIEEQEAPENPMVVFIANQGIEIISSGSGVVELVGQDEEYTNIIKVNHGNGYTSIYRSEAEAKVQEGDEVLRGTVLYQITANEQKMVYQIQQSNEYVDPLELMEIYG